MAHHLRSDLDKFLPHLGEIIQHESGGFYRVEVEDADKPEHETQTIHAIRLDFIPKELAT